MALVGYSDSEGSDVEESKGAVPAQNVKKLDRGTGNKIKVSIPSLKPEADTDAVAEPSAKRQRTGGAFGGFNSLLPAPKRVAQSIKPGINLKTSSEAAFSRARPPLVESVAQHDEHTEIDRILPVDTAATARDDPEPKVIGKATRFLPLSVANSKKKKKRPPAVAAAIVKDAGDAQSPAETMAKPQAKTKQSLFSMTDVDSTALSASAESYEPEFVHSSSAPTQLAQHALQDDVDNSVSVATELGGVATDLNLSASERRRLFGRHGEQGNVKIAHFDMDSEYKYNQDLAAKGETIEHRAVRAIAPGKHSLQQLVNNVKGQEEAIEDKWAEGRRARGETGSKYGW